MKPLDLQEINMTAPVKVRVALETGNSEALAAMRRKASRTKATKRMRKKLDAERAVAEEEAAEDWYQEKRQREAAKAHALEPWVVRRDNLLPPDQL